MKFPNIFSTHVLCVATGAGAPLADAGMGTMGSEIVS